MYAQCDYCKIWKNMNKKRIVIYPGPDLDDGVSLRKGKSYHICQSCSVDIINELCGSITDSKLISLKVQGIVEHEAS